MGEHAPHWLADFRRHVRNWQASVYYQSDANQLSIIKRRCRETDSSGTAFFIIWGMGLAPCLRMALDLAPNALDLLPCPSLNLLIAGRPDVALARVLRRVLRHDAHQPVRLIELLQISQLGLAER